MGNDINQYRARIGSFNNVFSKTRNYKIKPTNNYPTYKVNPSENLIADNQPYKLFYIKAVLMIPIIISVLTAINQSDTYLFKCNNPPSQTYLPGHVSTDLTTYFLLPYTVNVLAASSFKMVTNFQSRYLYGNRKNQGIKICHWNKGGSHLKNKMPEIRNIVSGLHPHIFGLSEANLHQTHDQTLVSPSPTHTF